MTWVPNIGYIISQSDGRKRDPGESGRNQPFPELLVCNQWLVCASGPEYVVPLLVKAGLAPALAANEVRGLVLAGPVLYCHVRSGPERAMAIWLAFCSLAAGIALSVVAPIFVARKFKSSSPSLLPTERFHELQLELGPLALVVAFLDQRRDESVPGVHRAKPSEIGGDRERGLEAVRVGQVQRIISLVTPKSGIPVTGSRRSAAPTRRHRASSLLLAVPFHRRVAGVAEHRVLAAAARGSIDTVLS